MQQQQGEVRDQTGQGEARSSRQGASRTGSYSLVRLHSRLSSRLDDFSSQGDLWLLFHHGFPFIVLRSQPFFGDDLEMTARGRRALHALGNELTRFPDIHSLIAGHTTIDQDGVEKEGLSCQDAWRQARSVEEVLVEAGADPARVLSVGVVRCDKGEEDLPAERLFDSPFVVTICFSFTNEEHKRPAQDRVIFA